MARLHREGRSQWSGYTVSIALLDFRKSFCGVFHRLDSTGV
ncbi:hypothetical protein [Roseisalinus antarcticus]|uniref:Uncharacterized protein n=1 Tax=Roseisalinus antarcticus TaxID=254357 RepID=A0A1Y5U2D0_9RHOB|nr:hypothetical protein [Roseisalinus antarcticus]SLN75019.1 hypothetical protein ROA7023_03874 [Roseisalinus antarcticus]